MNSLFTEGKQIWPAVFNPPNRRLCYAPLAGCASLRRLRVQVEFTERSLHKQRIQQGYNFDMAEGVEYAIDIRKPAGQRVENLRFHGQPVTPDQKFRLATNSYRVSGGGGYTMYAGAPELYRSSQEIRELIIDWVERNKKIPTEVNNNWRIVGAK